MYRGMLGETGTATHFFKIFLFFVAMVRSLEARGQAVNRLESCNFY